MLSTAISEECPAATGALKGYKLRWGGAASEQGI